MCEAKVYIKNNGSEDKVMDDVFILKKEGGKLYLQNIFGEQEIVNAEIKEVDLIAHKVILK